MMTAAALPSDIVVVGQGLPPAPGDAAYDVVTIDRDALSRSAGDRLETILRDAAGFQQFRRSDSRSAHPTSQGATLRGLGGNASSRALIVLDGIPQGDPFGGWVNWSAFAPATLGEVRVTRGGGSGAYGAGALAGTIELNSISPDDVAPLSAGLFYGNRNSIDADAGLSSKLGSGVVQVSASYQRGDGFIPIIASQRGAVDVAAPYRQGSLSGRVLLPVGVTTELQANTLLFFDQRTRGTAFTANRNGGADASLRLVGHGSWRWEASTWLQMREFRSQFSSVAASRATVSQSLDQYGVPATGIGGRFEIRPPLGDDIEMRIGGDARRTSGKTQELATFIAGNPTRIRDAGGRTLTTGTFADLSLTLWDQLTLTGGARVDRWTITHGRLVERTLATGALLPTSGLFPERKGTEPSGRAGLAFKPLASITLHSAAYTGWRLPTLNELYRPFRAGNDLTVANPALQPERLKGVDGGVEWHPLSSVRFAVSGYWNRLDNAIGNVTLGLGPCTLAGNVVAAGGACRQRNNLDAIVSKGIEAEGEIRYGDWRLSGSYAYVDARVRASGVAAALKGLRPAQTPSHNASVTLAWAPADRPSFSTTLRYVGNQFEDDQNSRVLRDVLTVDAEAELPIGKRFRIIARGENLSNAEVDATVSATGIIERATPRTLWIGVRYTG
jgi:outer membrane receptor protein involved in Fe transport